jgi:hypothetical protein
VTEALVDRRTVIPKITERRRSRVGDAVLASDEHMVNAINVETSYGRSLLGRIGCS